MIGAVLAAPALLIVFAAGMMGGGGCEGRESPCTGDYSRMWLAVIFILIVGGGVSWGTNLLVARVRSRKRNGER